MMSATSIPSNLWPWRIIAIGQYPPQKVPYSTSYGTILAASRQRAIHHYSESNGRHWQVQSTVCSRILRLMVSGAVIIPRLNPA